MRIQNFDYNSNLEKVLLWQYENATHLLQLVQREQIWVNENQSKFWSDWFKNVFNLNTANDFGLVVWTFILGLPVSFLEGEPDDKNKPIFGFDPYFKNFNNGVFTSVQQNNFVLTTEERRLILKLRYYQIISSGSLVEINENLSRIFSIYGNVYLIDNYAVDNSTMTIDYYFTFTPSQNFLNVLQAFDLLPRPATVKIDNIFII